MTPEEEAQVVRDRQENCEAHKRKDRPSWIPGAMGQSMTGGTGGAMQCAHCGVRKSDYEASATNALIAAARTYGGIP